MIIIRTICNEKSAHENKIKKWKHVHILRCSCIYASVDVLMCIQADMGEWFSNLWI